MATISDRPFSKNYSGLINQSVIAVGIFVVCITSHELMRRKRRGNRYHNAEGLGSVESWQFGYLYQGRSWAKNPSPPLPLGWPLSWVKQVLMFPEDRFNELRGVDASLYIRFLRGCFWFTLTHSLTTFPILCPIHIEFSEGTVSPKSMTRASISSLVATTKGQSLLWIHDILLIWVTLSWMLTLYWICCGAFRFRAQKIQEAADRAAMSAEAVKEAQFHPHPHPQYPFFSLPPLDQDGSNRGLRLRTVMVANIPPGLRTEKDLKEYFEYYMSRRISKPSMGVATTTQPGLLNRTFAFVFNRAKHIPSRLQKSLSTTHAVDPTSNGTEVPRPEDKANNDDVPVIDRVVLVRKMSDIASLLERREEILRLLETGHIRLARKALGAVKEAMTARPNMGFIHTATSKLPFAHHRKSASTVDVESGAQSQEGSAEGEDRMQLLIRTLSPYVKRSRSHPKHSGHHTRTPSRRRLWNRRDPGVEMESPIAGVSPFRDSSRQSPEKTVWDALLSLPRSALEAYQPLIHLNFFHGRTVPSIDYYTTKLNILTALIMEKRAKPVSDYPPNSTAFVTFANPADARRACKYLAVHPNNPLNACLVTMAPSYEDLDWIRLMKSTYRVEFVKDWVVNIGVWGFTIFWVFPVTLLVGLVSIQNISAFWPGLKRYLDKHDWEEELIQSFLPTILVALLALLIPLLLLLIAKKAHTISTLSALHDRIMTRYYKFLIVNVLVFFCVGTATLQSFLVSFSAKPGSKVIQIISDSFPSAGPFYVGWLIFTMAMHGGLELALFGLPLIVYPATKRQSTPRKRAVGIRPRTFNYYYWLPNHLLVLHILVLFSVLNPLVIPFGFLYFCVEATVVKNQLLHVYAKNYEGNGQFLLIRTIRYSLDGLILAHAVFLAYMVVLKKTANVAVAAVLIVFTVCVKMVLTRVCRARYDRDDLLEADIVCGTAPLDNCGPQESMELLQTPSIDEPLRANKTLLDSLSAKTEFWTMRLATKINFGYATIPNRPHRTQRRQPNPFGPRSVTDLSVPMQASSSTAGLLHNEVAIAFTPATPEVGSSAPNEQQRPDTSHGRSGTALVVPHPPHPAWDDDSSPDHPYDNPYYTRTISNTLWLPRDPLGILDLDDTVDLRISITSEPGLGKLGVWGVDEEQFVSSLSQVLASSFGSVEEDVASIPPVRELDGSEVINLPAGIASRVENIDHEDHVESTAPRRPSIIGRRRSSTSSTIRPSSLRRPSTFTGSPPTGFRSFSLGAQSVSSDVPSSFLSASSDRRRRNRAATMDTTISLRPPRPQSSQASKSLLSIIESPAMHTPIPPVDPTTSAISTREAVEHEVIQEEKEADRERRQQEEEEREKAKAPRSWWTSWMFQRPAADTIMSSPS